MPTVYNKRGTQYALSMLNPVLGSGELCLETDTNRIKFGDGVSDWNSLEYAIFPSGASNGQFLQYNATSGIWIPSSSGNFSTLQVSGTNVSVSGHTHTSSDITNFNSSVSGLLPSISGSTYINSNFSNNIYTISATGLQPLLTNPITGTGTSGYLSRFNSSTELTNSIVFESGTRLGINTVTPSGALHVVGSGLVASVAGTVPNSLFHLYSATSGANIFNVEGTNGSLFSVDDNLSGTLMSVNNNAGLPVFEVFSDDRVVAGRFNQNDFVINTSGNIGIGNIGDNSYKLNVTGSGNFTGDILGSGNITGRRLVASRSSGSEGGILSLAKPASGASVSGVSVNIDMFNNQLRIYEGGTPNRGYYLDITEGATGVATPLKTKSCAYFTAKDNQPPATNFATLDTRNSILVLEFDATTQESAVFVGVMPDNVVLTNGLTVRLFWMADTATSGNVRWGISFEEAGTDNDSDSFSTVTQANGTANGTSGIETITSITATDIDSLVAGDRYRLKITRIADDATNDTMTGDAQLIAVEVRAT